MTPKQKAFVAEYLKDFNATQAAIRAGYSKKTAGSQGERLLKNVEIADEVEVEIERRMMSDDEVRVRFAKIARFDFSPYVKTYGKTNYIDLDLLIEDGHGDMIRSVKHTQHGDIIEFADPEWGLERIAKAKGMFVNKHEVTGADGGPVLTRIVEKRDAADQDD